MCKPFRGNGKLSLKIQALPTNKKIVLVLEGIPAQRFVIADQKYVFHRHGQKKFP